MCFPTKGRNKNDIHSHHCLTELKEKHQVKKKKSETTKKIAIVDDIG